MKKTFLLSVQVLLVLCLFVTVGCKEEEDKAPTCSIVSPTNNAEFFSGEMVSVSVTADAVNSIIVDVQLYIDNVGYGSTKTFPYNFSINAKDLSVGAHTLKAVVISDKGLKGEATLSVNIMNNVTTETKLEIGMEYQGGIIFYLDASEKHGLIAAKKDQGLGEIEWSNGSNWDKETKAIGTAIGTGKSNTATIVYEFFGIGIGNYAAKICDDLVLEGYNDWFLPSKDELELVYQSRELIGGFSQTTYWSSSADAYNSGGYYPEFKYAWNQNFISGSQSTSGKDNIYRVRAIREF